LIVSRVRGGLYLLSSIKDTGFCNDRCEISSNLKFLIGKVSNLKIGLMQCLSFVCSFAVCVF